MIFLLALTAAGLYGVADFLGGFASKRASALAVLVLSELVSIATVLVALRLLPDAHALPADYAWGAAAGLVGGGGLALFYKGLATGTMSVFAPIAAVTGIAIPVVVGLAIGERPGTLPLIGVGLAAIAIVCVSMTMTSEGPTGARTLRAAISRTALGSAVVAGIAFGFFYVLIQRASPSAGMWPLVAARVASVVGLGLLAVVTGRSLGAPRSAWGMIAATGFFDMVASICFLLALDRGLLSIVVTIASLYPAATMLLARFFLRERLGFVQVAGLVVATIAVVLITAGG